AAPASPAERLPPAPPAPDVCAEPPPEPAAGSADPPVPPEVPALARAPPDPAPPPPVFADADGPSCVAGCDPEEQAAISATANTTPRAQPRVIAPPARCSASRPRRRHTTSSFPRSGST